MSEPSHSAGGEPIRALRASAHVSVQDATDTDGAAWDRYLATRPDGSFYHLFGWRQVLRSTLGLEPVYLLACENGQIVGVLPMVLLSSRLFGRILCSMPFLNYGGPCADSEAAATSLTTVRQQNAGCPKPFIVIAEQP